ncbi:HGGxSTG domain-containing protein [Lichenibacterium minor]
MVPRSENQCGARTRQGGACGNLGMTNGRCRFHGGLSTGPRTAEGMARMRAANTIHGARGQDAQRFRKMLRSLEADARRLGELA